MAKNYFTVKTLLDRAIEQAKADPRFTEAEKACPLENWGIRSLCQHDKLRSCAFDVIGCVSYGGCEGIYGDIIFQGKWDTKDMSPMREYMRVYSMKTLRDGKKSYLAMGSMVNLICYYANEFVRNNLDRFD